MIDVQQSSATDAAHLVEEGSNLTITAVELEEDSGDPFVSDEMLETFTLVNYVIIICTISFFGIIFNIINIIVFVKMGFKDPVNIKLASLAIADAGSLIPLFWTTLCFNPLLIQAFTYLNFQAVHHLTAGWPHVIFSRITSWMTALITFERYLCVALPLKVKTIVTPKRTVTAVLIIFAVTIAGAVPVYCGISLGPQIQPDSNRTVVQIFYASNGHVLEDAALAFAASSQFIAFLCVLVCTIGLVQKIQSNTKWRSTISTSSDTTSARDRRIVKMVVYIATIFIISYLPVVMGLLVMVTYAPYNITGRYSNLFLATWTFAFGLESINSSVNIFVYLKMNSKYRMVFMTMFRLKSEEGK